MIHLHIGRHKTGSTALQRFLKANREALAARGLTCLTSAAGDPALHELANALTPRRRAQASPAQLEAFTAEEARVVEALGAPGDKIASSEGFQNATPDRVARIFPPGATTVVVYLREQLDYLLSAYAQSTQAQATRRSFVDFAGGLDRRTDYGGFLDAWAGAFGPERLAARVYAREAFDGGDLRRDFLAVLGLEPDGLKFQRHAANASIGPELVEAKGLIDAYVPLAVQRRVRLYPLLGRLAAAMPGRLLVPTEFADAIRGRFAASNADLFARWFRERPEGFPLADLTGSPLVVDRLAALEQALGLLDAMSPEASAAIRERLPASPDLDQFPALLPTNWHAATDEVGRKLGAGLHH